MVGCGQQREHVAVWRPGSGASDVWIVGAGFGAILHWAGQTWSLVNGGTPNWLMGVWGTGPDISSSKPVQNLPRTAEPRSRANDRFPWRPRTGATSRPIAS